MKRKVVEALKYYSKINVSQYVFENYSPYEDKPEFLEGPTKKTEKIWSYCEELLLEEMEKGVVGIDTDTISTITSHSPGYICEEDDVIVGLQTEEPLKRAIKPFGGIGIVDAACTAYGYELNEDVKNIFNKYRKTHNQGVFDVYSKEMRDARSNGIITGLPDGYGRGRIIGDYRRVALYGVDTLIEEKQKDKLELQEKLMDEENIRLIGEVTDQIKALHQLKEMATEYGHDISKPAETAKEAVQWLYYGYLGSVKEQDGAAMSFGRIDSFLDIFIEKDIAEGKLTEVEAQELIDQFIIKLRIVRHLRTPEYNDLFAGDPTWVTLVLGGKDPKERPLVTKTTYRILNSLYNLGPAPEPNITVLWSQDAPKNFKDFVSKISIDTSSIQYISDDLMNPLYGSDYAIACCVSGMQIGKEMQFFGARCNLGKLLLYTFNNGVDEINKTKWAPDFGTVEEGKALVFEEVWDSYSEAMDWITELYVNTMNVIHYNHDKYCYEYLQMALHDTEIHRYMAFGIAGLSVVADSFSAIKYAEVYPVKGEDGLVESFEVIGDFPKFGNDDDRVDDIAKELCHQFTKKLKRIPTYRHSEHTLSVLTITSNVVYGKMTGDTPDGRVLGDAFAPGANPMHGRDEKGAVASLSSVGKISYEDCKDGISNTFSIVPSVLGKTEREQITNLETVLDGYFTKGFHLNVNVLDREMLIDAMENPEKYPNLTIRVSGYAVNFSKLDRAKQLEVIARTFHESF